ncbi:MAG: DUF4091 domain-containing protein [Defluviitaleaceae bacterium]|nr:DUF4091 domain-containing protein [Defluviitaleaceae bacterium]
MQVELRILSSLAKVFPNNAPPERPESKWLAAFRGETISFQVAYQINNKGPRLWAHMKVNAPDEVQITTRRVRYIPGYIPSHFKTDDGYLSTESGLYPDLLEPVDTQRLPLISGTWQSIWVDITVPETAKPGHYPISVELKTPSGEDLGFAQRFFEILPAQLPPLSIPRTMWFYTDCLAQYYDVEAFSERHWEIIEDFAACAVQHGINALLTPIHTPPLDTEIGNERLTTQLIDVAVSDSGQYIFGFEKLNRWVEMCRRIGVEYYEIAHLFTQWGARHAPKIMGTKNGEYVQLFGWETDAIGPEYTDYLRQMLPALTAKLKDWGIAEKSFFHISDEPSLEHLEVYMEARKIVEPLLKGFKITDALTNYDFFKQGAVSVPIPAVDHIQPFLDGDVPELWCYYCCVQSYKVPNHFFMQPSYRNRILGTLLYKYNIAGFLHWGYNFYNCVHSVYPVDPYRVTDADGSFPSGDSYVVYPGPDGKPLASLRLMVAMEAFNDFRALKLLEELADRDTVLALVDEGLQNPITFSDFPQNEEYLLQLRLRVNARIKELL